MPATYRDAPHIGMPIPAHTQTPGADAAREAMLTYARRDRAAPPAADPDVELVVAHPHVIDNARRLLETAQAAGFDAALTLGTYDGGQSVSPACRVEGINRRRGVGFRALWRNGKAELGIWYDPRTTARIGELVGVLEVTRRVKGGAS